MLTICYELVLIWKSLEIVRFSIGEMISSIDSRHLVKTCPVSVHSTDKLVAKRFRSTKYRPYFLSSQNERERKEKKSFSSALLPIWYTSHLRKYVYGSQQQVVVRDDMMRALFFLHIFSPNRIAYVRDVFTHTQTETYIFIRRTYTTLMIAAVVIVRCHSFHLSANHSDRCLGRCLPHFRAPSYNK